MAELMLFSNETTKVRDPEYDRDLKVIYPFPDPNKLEVPSSGGFAHSTIDSPVDHRHPYAYRNDPEPLAAHLAPR